MKKVISLVLSLVMLLSITAGIDLSAYALDDSGFCGENVTYTFDSSTGTLTIFGSGDMYDFEEDSPFYNDTNIKTVTIENGVTSIGDYAFYNCSSLTSVTIPDSVTSIGEFAFSDCRSLAETTIPNSVTSIGESAFYYCKSLTSITIGNGVKSIGNDAFMYCSSLSSVTIPDSVASIGSYAFYYCSSLNKVNYTGTVDDWCEISFGNAYSNPTYYANKLYINDVLLNNAVITTTKINDYAFYNCTELTELTMPCSAKIYNSKYTFYNCTNIKKITLTKGTGVMQDYSTSTSDSDTYYQYTPWYISNCPEIVIEDDVTSIGDYAFYDCKSLTSVTIGNGVKSIGENAFYKCSKLTDVYYLSNATEWNNINIKDNNECLTGAKIHCINSGFCGENATWTFDDSTGTLTISGTGDMYNYGTDISPFEENTNFKTLVIEDGITKIGSCAFYNCSSLTSVTIPDSVTTIGSFAFYNCSSLTNVTVPNGVTNIQEAAFRNCSSLATITIPDSVTYMGIYLFYGCSSLTSVTIPNGVTSIGDEAFRGCSNLANVTIGNGVTEINRNAFEDCSSLTSVTIPNGVTSIGNCAFLNCSSLASITMPDSVASIGNYAFEGTAYFNDESNWENGVLYIDNALIKAKSNSILSDYEVKSKTTVIGNYAFSYCTKLTSVSIPANVIGIGNYAFEGCDKLTNVYYTGTEEEWNSIDVENYNDELLGSNVYYNCCEVHTWNDGEVIKEATCTSKGTKKYACTICSVTKTESIDKISHTSKKTVTKATTKANGKITYTCSVCGATTKKATTIYYPKTITLSATTYTYNGKAQKPTVKVVDANGKTVVSSNYTVTYASGCKNVGSYKVTIKFKGNYSGTVTKTFKINPKGTSVSSLTAKSNGFAVNWKKQATQTTGYQIQYSTSSNFSNAKTVTVSKNSTTSKTISKLTGKKKYYVRVRTYKTVDGTKYYSSWSSAKSVTTKSSASSNAVYRTPSGKCYHYSANCGGKNSYKITMAQAKSAGLKPCKKCVL